jgi:phasin family protein
MEDVMTQWDSVMTSETESGKALEAINLKLVEQLTKKQVELVTSAFETSNKWVSSFGEVKALPELFSFQSKLASEYSAKVVATARETADLFASSREEYKVWFEKGFQTLSAQAEAVVPKPATSRKAA